MNLLVIRTRYSSLRRKEHILTCLIPFICSSNLYFDRFRCLERLFHQVCHCSTPFSTLYIYVRLEVLRQLRIVWNHFQVLVNDSAVYDPV